MKILSIWLKISLSYNMNFKTECVQIRLWKLVVRLIIRLLKRTRHKQTVNMYFQVKEDNAVGQYKKEETSTA